MKRRSVKPKVSAQVVSELRAHFNGVPLPELVTASREFPIAARVDLQGAVPQVLDGYKPRLIGVHRMYGHSTMTFSDLLNTQHDPVLVAPLQYSEIDVGEVLPRVVSGRVYGCAVRIRCRFVCFSRQ